MKAINITKGNHVLVDEDDYNYLVKNHWYAVHGNGGFYAARRKNYKIVFMHNEIMKPEAGFQVDHINRDTLDNRKENLQFCTVSQNRANAPKKVYKLGEKPRSSYKGVTWCKRDSKWISQIKFEGKNHFLGRFSSELDAARAYDKRALEIYGSFAVINGQ